MDDSEFEKFNTDLGAVLQYIKHSKSKDELATIVSKNSRFKSLDPDSANLINILTESDLRLDEKGGKVDMCQAIADMRRESERKGREDMKREMAHAIADMRRQMYDAYALLVSNNILSPQDAASRFGISIEDIQAAALALDASATTN